jgi:trehalose 6-phosphate phosphatase
MTGSSRTLPNLLVHWDAVASRFRDSARVALFLDFDGTLAPIVPRPDQVRLAPATRRLLGRLASHSRVLVTVISGRRRAELLHYIAVGKVRYLGLYGWERNRRSAIPRPAQIALRHARAVLRENLSAFPGVWIEDKSSSLSIHVAAARPGVAANARRSVGLLLRPFRKHLRVLENIRDLEIAPLCVPDKGAAVRQCLATREFRHALPVYFGDDYSDEPAFAAARQGVSVLVGNRRPTHARFGLRDPGEVADALTRLEASLA